MLQLAKLVQYRAHYCIFKPCASDFPQERVDLIRNTVTESEYEFIKASRELIESIYLCYTDTDSLHYFIVFKEKNLTLEDVFKKTSFSLFIDRSNFKYLKKNPKDFDENRSDLFKSEIADNVAIEGAYVSAKCYSVKTIDRGSVRVRLRSQVEEENLTTPPVATSGQS